MTKSDAVHSAVDRNPDAFANQLRRSLGPNRDSAQHRKIATRCLAFGGEPCGFVSHTRRVTFLLTVVADADGIDAVLQHAEVQSPVRCGRETIVVAQIPMWLDGVDSLMHDPEEVPHAFFT